ncbi:beta strand repeat-containing protein, partial [Novipirellula sp.]|uniref:beta strand repeat-containing protein n=1 Tax=Novipirellula sp. TaxID=2795430 RepID=UPI003569AD02
NGDFSSGGSGVDFRDAVDNAVVTISGNSFANTAGDAIRFGATTPSSLVNRITDVTVNIGSANNVTIDQTTVAVGGNVISGSANGSGINVEAMVQGDSEFVISGNTIGSSGNRVGQDGIRFAGGILDSSTVTLGGSNQVFASGQAIQVDDLQSPSTLAITDGTYDGNDGALLVDNTGVAGTDGRLNVGAAAFVGGNGSTVVEVLTDAGNAGVDIDFAGAATITGGATGLRLSGSGIDILGDWLGNLAFSSQTGDYITLANGAEFLPGSPTLIDAHSVSFDGMLGSDMTLPQLLAAEDRVTHYPDDKSLGLIDIASLFVVEGESIQTAVNAAGAMAGPQTVAVAAGTFGGSVELWVNNLSLVGSGATTIIDTNAVDAFANNGDVNNGFHVAAISGTSGGGDVSGVTIDGFAFDSLSSSGNNIGVELGATGLSDALGTTVQNSSFADLQHGVVARAIDGLTTISTISTNNIASHGVDFNAALDSGDTILVEDSSISGGDDGLRFSSSLTGSDITIRGNTIEGADDGLEFNDAIGGGSTVRIAGNSRVEGLGTASGEDNLGDGIAFRGVITGATTNILIDDNTLIRGLDRGINFASAGTGGPASITDASVTISRNDEIRGLGIDGILFNAGLSNATITIGGDTAAEGNGLIVGDDDGIDIENVNGGAFTIANNASITGNSLNGIEFEGAVNNGAEVAIVNNSSIISNNDDAIRFVDDLTNSSVRIEGNAIQALRDGVALAAVIEGTTDLRISDNTIHVDGSGIAQTTASSIVDDASVVIAANSITLTGAAGTGISLNNLGSTQAIVIDANQIIGGEFGIVASQLAAGVFEGQVQIGNTTISAAHDTGLMFVNRNAASSLEVDLQGGLMVHGGASAADNGIVFDGSGLSLRANTLSDTHFTSQNGNYVELRNGGLFETGSPTLVDATDVMFDSLDATTASGYQAAELKLVHFLDDPSLGLIYPGVVNNWGGQLTYDRFTRYQDYFRTIGSLLEMNSIIIRYPAAEIVIADELDE